MTQPLSADGIELKVGMPVWNASDGHWQSPQPVNSIRPRADDEPLVRNELCHWIASDYYATEKAFLEHRMKVEVGNERDAANALQQAKQYQMVIQSRLAALTEGERTL